MNNENFTIERNEITYVITDGYPTSFRSTTRKSLSPNDEIFIAFPEDNLNVDNPKKRNHRRRHIAEHFGEDLFYLMDEQAATDIAEFIAEKANTTIYGKTYRDEYEAWREYVVECATARGVNNLLHNISPRIGCNLPNPLESQCWHPSACPKPSWPSCRSKQYLVC